VATDQRDFLLREGSVENVVMSGTATSLYTDIATMAWVWGLGVTTTIPANGVISRAQKSAKLGTVTDLSPRVFGILQQNNVSSKMRLLAFRKARVTDPQDMNMQGRTTSAVDFNLVFDPDPAIIDGTDFGLYFEET
jgi:hypothetical protein